MLIKTSNALDASADGLLGKLFAEAVEVTAYEGEKSAKAPAFEPVETHELVSEEVESFTCEYSATSEGQVVVTDEVAVSHDPAPEVPAEQTKKGPTTEMKRHLAAVKKKVKSKMTVFFGESFEAAAFSQAGNGAERKGNEDRFTLVEEVAPQIQLLAVYDGHGGDDASEYLRERFPQELSKRLLMQGEDPDLSEALRRTISSIDEKFCAQFLPGDDSDSEEEEAEEKENGYVSDGSCLVAALYNAVDNTLVLANVGDCRAVLGFPVVYSAPAVVHPEGCDDCRLVVPDSLPNQEGALNSAVALTTDHDSENSSELKRIIAAGGHVDKDGYIFGEMQPSRAIGDVQFKGGDPSEPTGVIISDPEIHVHTNVPDTAVLILASDGFWDVVSNKEGVDLAFEKLEEMDLQQACSALVKEAAARGSEDDITVAALHIGCTTETES